MTERTFTVLLPLEPLKVGRTIVRARWPRHVTVVSNLRTATSLDVAIAVVRALAARLPPQRGVVGERAWFGPGHDVPVELVDGFQVTHETVLDALEARLPFVPVDTAQHRDGYRGHVTTTAAGLLHPGAVVEPSSIALAEVGPGGDLRIARPLAVFELGTGSGPPSRMPASTAALLCEALRSAGIAFQVVGGWGVDALLGRQTREHHDLDLLVDADDLPRLDEVLGEHGIAPAFVWEEDVALELAGETRPSAFVALGGGGVEVDVHAVSIGADGVPVMRTAGATRLDPDALGGRGTIAGVPVPCFSAAAQRTAHTGYDLPEQQVRDLALLDGLAGHD